jgi:hypothetical protein
MKAWLITWEWMGTHVAVDQPIVDILSARTGAKIVREYLERIYILHKMSLAEKVELARYSRPSRPPYPAHFVTVGDKGIPYQGRIHCGDNPWLHARKVDNLVVVRGDNWIERVTWDELPLPNFSTELPG